jgi:hypothetical protein
MNNFKIQKLREQQFEKSKMDDMLKNLKKVLIKWQALLNQDLNQQMQVAFDQTSTPSNMRESYTAKKLRRSINKTASLLEDTK